MIRIEHKGQFSNSYPNHLGWAMISLHRSFKWKILDLFQWDWTHHEMNRLLRLVSAITKVVYLCLFLLNGLFGYNGHSPCSLWIIFLLKMCYPCCEPISNLNPTPWIDAWHEYCLSIVKMFNYLYKLECKFMFTLAFSITKSCCTWKSSTMQDISISLTVE